MSLTVCALTSELDNLSFSGIPRLVRLYQASATGSRLDIACEIDCSPISRCTVVWYFESRAVDPETSKYDTSSDGSVHLLSVQQPGEGDLGRYACVLRSQFSEEEEDDRRTITVALPGTCMYMYIALYMCMLLHVCMYYAVTCS